MMSLRQEDTAGYTGAAAEAHGHSVDDGDELWFVPWISLLSMLPLESYCDY